MTTKRRIKFEEREIIDRQNSVDLIVVISFGYRDVGWAEIPIFADSLRGDISSMIHKRMTVKLNFISTERAGSTRVTSLPQMLRNKRGLYHFCCLEIYKNMWSNGSFMYLRDHGTVLAFLRLLKLTSFKCCITSSVAMCNKLIDWEQQALKVQRFSYTRYSAKGHNCCYNTVLTHEVVYWFHGYNKSSELVEKRWFSINDTKRAA